MRKPIIAWTIAELYAYAQEAVESAQRAGNLDEVRVARTHLEAAVKELLGRTTTCKHTRELRVAVVEDWRYSMKVRERDMRHALSLMEGEK